MPILKYRPHQELWLVTLNLLVVGVILGLQIFFHDRASRQMLDAVRWSVEALLYAGFSYLIYQQSSDQLRATLGWFCVGWILFALGQLIRDLELANHWPIYAAPSDRLLQCLGICFALGLLLGLLRGLSVGLRWALFMDLFGIGVLILTLSLAYYLPNLNKNTILQISVLASFPFFYLLALGLLIQTVLLKKIIFDWSCTLLLLGFIANTFSWLFWNAAQLQNQDIDGTYSSYSFTFSWLALLLGGSRWKGQSSQIPSYRAQCWRWQRLLPLLLIMAAAMAALYSRTQPNAHFHHLIAYGAVSMVVFAIIRQSLLLYEQESTLQAKIKLRQQASNLKALIEYSNDLIFRVGVLPDRQFHYLSLSHGFEELTGIPVQKALGKTPHEIFPSVLADQFIGQYRRCLEEKKPLRQEQLFTTATSAVWFDTLLIPLKNEENIIREITGVCRNISSSKSDLEALKTSTAELEQVISQRTQQVQEACREIEMFSHSVSTDLRAPLRSINRICETLRKEFTHRLDEPGVKHLERIFASSQRMVQIIDDLLKLSQVSRSSMNLSEVNLSRLAQKICLNLQSLEPHRRVQFTIAPDLWVTADAPLVELALENLLANAWKYTSRHPTAHLEFGLIEEGQSQIFFVRDDGAGFEMAYADKLFQAFQRLHHRREFEGIGIGLAIVARVIRRHHGRIWAIGAVEQGATFFFTLPRPNQLLPSVVPEFKS